MDTLHVIAGLGNPGTRYDNTRHNVGFGTIDRLSDQYGIKVNKIKHKALLGDGTIKGERVLLVKPQTYMNLSGESLREIVEWYKLPTARLVVIYDDVDLPLGRIRVRPKGSSGTHNGMRSILYQLQTEEFPRVRIGIGKAPEGWDLADYVLGKFGPEDRKTAEEGMERAAEAAAEIVASGIQSAMNKFNS